MKFFSLEAILCVRHVTFNEKIIFCYLNRVPPNPDIRPEHHAHSQLHIRVFTLTVTLRGTS